MMELPKRHAIPLKVSRFAPMQKILTGFLSASAAPPPLTTAGRNFEAGQRTWIPHARIPSSYRHWQPPGRPGHSPTRAASLRGVPASQWRSCILNLTPRPARCSGLHSLSEVHPTHSDSESESDSGSDPSPAF